MADYAQVCELFARYATAVDSRDDALLRGVLTDDARFVIRVAGGPALASFESAGAIIAGISGTTARQHGQRRHVLTNVWRHGDTARTVVSLFETAGGQLRVLSTGTYRTTVVDQGGDVRFCDIVVTLDR